MPARSPDPSWPDLLTSTIVKMAAQYDLEPRPVSQSRGEPDRETIYINLDVSGRVAAQIHHHERRDKIGDRVLVIGSPDENCPTPVLLEEMPANDFCFLSGDWGPNKNWLRAESEVFKHLQPARAFIVPKDLASVPAEDRRWVEVSCLLEYARDNVR